MYICILIVELLFIKLLAESTMSPTLTLYKKEELFQGCQLWSSIFKDKHLCFGGEVSFLMSSTEIGEAVHITVTSADSKIPKMSTHIAFDKCGQLSIKTNELEELVCSCTSDLGNKSFTYVCAMTFNTSYSGSMINAFLEHLNGSHVKDVYLKLPAINKEENTSKSNIPQIKQIEYSSTNTSEKAYIGIIVFLAAVIVILIIGCVCLFRKNRRQAQEIQAKDEKLTRLKAENEKWMQEDKNRDIKATEVEKESRKMSDAMVNSRAKKLKSMSNDVDAAQKLGQMEEDDIGTKTSSELLIPLMCRLPTESIQAAKDDKFIELH